MVVSYQPTLVLLSVGIAFVGSFTSLAMTSGWRDVRHRGSFEAGFSLTNGGLIMGATIWSMHFTAMMAVKFPVPISYNIVETILSNVVAAGVTAMGLVIISNRRLGSLSIPGAGVLMGLGIASMHYLGMSAIRGCGVAYNAILVAASIAIAIVASMAALWLVFHKRSMATTLAGGVVQGLAIAAMHYTAMAATYFVPLDAPAGFTIPLFDQDSLAFMITGAMLAVCTGNLAMLGFMSSRQKRLV